MEPPREPPIRWPEAVRTVLVTVAAFAVAGALGGWVWASVTKTARYEVTQALPDPLPEGALVTASFDGDMWFLVVGVVGGLLTGFACTALFRLRGLVTLVAVVAGAALASMLTYRIGLALGPAPLPEQAAAIGVGGVLTYPLEISATGVFLAWPAAATAGLMAAVSLLTPALKAPAQNPDVG